MAKEYIERNALVAEYDRVHIGPPGGARKLMEEAPTADVVEVKHGEWIGKPIAGYARIKCSVCTTSFVQETGTWAYCPECGADMRGKINEKK